ncbi:MAG TPA: hypothetical protein VMU67_09670 [Steroidobacteraceae bacterium]|nr:hypothetical protein [Steroidobacteraceae bacterium]
MERLLLLWDEVDDVLAVCRHVAAITAEEVAGIAGPLAATLAALAAGGLAASVLAPWSL